jgi:hypothetical protein
VEGLTAARGARPPRPGQPTVGCCLEASSTSSSSNCTRSAPLRCCSQDLDMLLELAFANMGIADVDCRSPRL